MRLIALSFLAIGCALADGRVEIDINTAQVWTDTRVDLQPGDSLSVSAFGNIQVGDAHAGPEGLPRVWGDLTAHYPVAGAGHGALIARFTDNPAARPFFIGPSAQRIAPVAGRLFLGINEPEGHADGGSFHVIVQWTHAAVRTVAYYPVFPQDMLDRIPVQAADPAGYPSDRVNVLIVGNVDKLQAAFSDAGWLLAEKNTKTAVWHGLMASLSKEPYATMPMKPLALFGRPQDMGYVQGDSLKVVESRHELRIWQTPYSLYGKPVWAVAGVRDSGIDKNIKNGINNKVDPATDRERDYIAESLRLTGFTVNEQYMLPAMPMEPAVQPGPKPKQSPVPADGRTLIIFLQP